MKQLTNDVEMVTAMEERAVLEIAQLERELDLVEYEEKKVKLDLTTLASENAWRGRAVETTAGRDGLGPAEARVCGEDARDQPGVRAGLRPGDPVRRRQGPIRSRRS